MYQQHINIGITTIALAFGLSSVNAEVAQSGHYKIDPAHTSVQFSISHLGTSILVGRFNDVAGEIQLQPKAESKVAITIKSGSIDTNHDKRDKHLRSPDFFNAKQFPQISFVSNKVSYNAKGEPQQLHGTLTMHGKRQPVSLNIKAVGAGKDPWGGYRAGYQASTSLKRSDFGMNFMPGGIGDEVTVSINLEAIKQ